MEHQSHGSQKSFRLSFVELWLMRCTHPHDQSSACCFSLTLSRVHQRLYIVHCLVHWPGFTQSVNQLTLMDHVGLHTRTVLGASTQSSSTGRTFGCLHLDMVQMGSRALQNWDREKQWGHGFGVLLHQKSNFLLSLFSSLPHLLPWQNDIWKGREEIISDWTQR